MIPCADFVPGPVRSVLGRFVALALQLFAPGLSAGGRDIRALNLRVGEDLEIPLSLDENYEARFNLREALLERTQLHLNEGGSQGAENRYRIRLADFTVRE